MSDATRRTARTMAQTVLARAVLLPAVVHVSGPPAALPRVAGALAVAGALTGVAAVPGPATHRADRGRDRRSHP
ncbi:hypothetical protein [Streptomyces sp. NPDC096323]|uniref:hypothetical protein n=1 Tax=Streptomyces sp. NPDC096323 TaxID=3155822 RepID=UPI00331A3200